MLPPTTASLPAVRFTRGAEKPVATLHPFPLVLSHVTYSRPTFHFSSKACMHGRNHYLRSCCHLYGSAIS